MDIKNWVSQVIKGVGGFLSWEEHEMPTYHNTRDEQIAAFVLRCLANSNCEGSREVLAAIIEQRVGTVPDHGTGFRPPWQAIHKDFNFCAIDRTGIIFLYKECPATDEGLQAWWAEVGVKYPFSIAGLVENWQECMWMRPGHGEKEGAE